MKLRMIAAATAVASVLTAGALGAAGGVAGAQPPVPLKPGHGHDDGPWQPNRDDYRGRPDRGHDRGAWDGRWDNDHRWGAWRDWDRPPNWGWGPPPTAYYHAGLPGPYGPPPPAFDYYGYRAQPVWDPGYGAWGIWLFGLWIPLVAVG